MHGKKENGRQIGTERFFSEGTPYSYTSQPCLYELEQRAIIPGVACAAHVRVFRSTCTAGYRLLFIKLAELQVQFERDAAPRGITTDPPRDGHRNRHLLIAANVWFVRETASNCGSETIRATARYNQQSSPRIIFSKIIFIGSQTERKKNFCFSESP